jgi:hypothetical protein
MRSGVFGLLACALVSCGRTVDSDPPDANGGASGGTGGTPDHGTGGTAMSGTGGTAMSGTGGTAMSSTGGTAMSGTGGTATGGTGGTSAGETDGSVDVCRAYGAPCCGPAIASVSPGGSCVLDVFSEGVSTSYEYAVLEQRIAEKSPGILLSLTDTDIAWAAAEPAPNTRLEMHLTPQASSLHGENLEWSRNLPFRLSCGGQSLFVGVVYYREGAAALRTPVLHVARDPDGSVVLQLGAWQGAWGGWASGGDSELRARIDRPELRAALCERGALRELDADGG